MRDNARRPRVIVDYVGKYDGLPGPRWEYVENVPMSAPPCFVYGEFLFDLIRAKCRALMHYRRFFRRAAFCTLRFFFFP